MVQRIKPASESLCGRRRTSEEPPRDPPPPETPHPDDAETKAELHTTRRTDVEMNVSTFK